MIKRNGHAVCRQVGEHGEKNVSPSSIRVNKASLD